MNKKFKDIDENDFIDLIKIFSKIYINKKKILLSSFIFGIIGVVYSLLINDVYKSSSIFYPHYENIDQTQDGLRSLAGLAGINLQNQVSKNVPTNLYPELIESTKFKLKLLDEQINRDGLKYKDYLLNTKNGFNPINSFFSLFNLSNRTKISKKKINDNLKYISSKENDLFKIIDNKISLSVNKQDGFIELSVYDEDPEISAIIAMKANDILQKSIINFQLENINDIYNFTTNQLKIAKSNLYKLQDSLANFRDGNKSIKSDLFLNKLNRLETEVNISTNVYNELAIVKEKTAIDVRKNTPIFTIIKSVVVPIEKDSPNRKLIVFYFIKFVTIYYFLQTCQ